MGDQELTPDVIRSLRDSMKAVVRKVWSDQAIHLTESAVTYVTDQYFKAIQVGDDQLMTDLVVINEFTPEDLPTSDLAALVAAFDGTLLHRALADALKRKSS